MASGPGTVMASGPGTEPAPPHPAVAGRAADQAAAARPARPAAPVPGRPATSPRVAGDIPAVGAAQDSQRKVAVTEALRTLSPAHRQVLNETILRGRTVNDAAAALGIPVGAVKARVYYALHALRVALAERGMPEASVVRVARCGGG
jgi:DNA-directed RNA polymerase specialized sigma24 family protein